MPTLADESLPFKVGIASRQSLFEVARLRAESYGKHLPTLAESLSQPESADFARGCEVFVAKSKLDGSLLGTLRTHSNAFNALPMQTSIKLPERFRHTRMVETTRLCIKGSPNASVVRGALFKALYQYCMQQNVAWIMVAGRRPVDRIYDGLLFDDVDKPGTFYPMAHAAGVPHRVMCFSLSDAEYRWRTQQHPLYQFVIETRHTDVDVSNAQDLNFPWESPEPKATVSQFPDRRQAPREIGALWGSGALGLAA
jgi:hypothetical protein